jgi:hypothetical protein
LGALIRRTSEVRCGARFLKVGWRCVASAVGVSAGRGRICRFQALSCIRTMAIDSPCPAGRQLDIARSISATKGWQSTAETRRHCSDLVESKRSAYATVNYQLSAIQGLPSRFGYTIEIHANRHPH